MKRKQVIALDKQFKDIASRHWRLGNSDFYIVARTDARQARELSEAITCGIAFKEAGYCRNWAE